MFGDTDLKVKRNSLISIVICISAWTVGLIRPRAQTTSEAIE
jgi:hypothetical protein